MRIALKKIKLQYIRTWYIILFLIPSIISVTAFSQSTKKIVDEYINKHSEYINDAQLYKKILECSENEVLEALADRLNDTSAVTKNAAIRTLTKIFSESENLKNRKHAVSYILKKIQNDDDPSVKTALNYLTMFNPDDFDPESKYIISRRVQENASYLNDFVLLTGWLNIDELIFSYKQMLEQTDQYSKKDRWYMQLALARMGDEQTVNSILEKINNIPVNDDVVYDIYPYLAYTRQKKMFDFLFEKIISDDKNCLSSNPDNEVPIICAYRIMEYIGPYIIDFPLKTDKTGDLIIENYKDDLEKVRKWYDENKDNYKLITNKY